MTSPGALMTHSPHWLKALRSMRFMQLLFFSFGSMLVQALFTQSALLSFAMSLLYLNALAVALSASGAHRYISYTLCALWLVSLLARLFPPTGMELAFLVLSKCLGALLLAICIIAMAHYMFFRRRVTLDTLFAAVVIYVLIAILFAQLYGIAGNLLPNGFSFPAALAVPAEFAGHPDNLPDGTYTYFSFVTIATLGYGDIAPLHPVAQVLVSIEAVIGQFYVAIVVARLMSLYAAARREHE